MRDRQPREPCRPTAERASGRARAATKLGVSAEDRGARPTGAPKHRPATRRSTERLGQPDQLGDVARQGDLPGALAAFDEGLTIFRDLAARDPGNAGWARDVSVSLNKVGDVRVAQGDLPGALAAFDESLTIRRDLAARDPGNAGWARDVSVSLDRSATCASPRATSPAPSPPSTRA